MQIKSILAGAAIALVAGLGSAYAADQFTTLDGVQAQPMNTAEMGQVRGTEIVLAIPGPGATLVEGLGVDDLVAAFTAGIPGGTRTVPQ